MCLAVPGKILSIRGEGIYRTGQVSFGGVTKEVNLSCVPDAKEGDYVVVHVGFAISIMDDEEARESLKHYSTLSKATDQ